MSKSDALRGPSTGASRNAADPSKNAPQSRTDLEVSGQPNDEKKTAKALKNAMSQGNQAIYSRTKR